MKSGKQKRAELMQRRLEKAERNFQPKIPYEKTAEFLKAVASGEIVPVDPSKIRSTGGPGHFPLAYEDVSFTCHDCGKAEVWTRHQQKWWYEIAGGVWESTAIRCRKCRAIERKRKAEVRQATLEGLKKKQQQRLDAEQGGGSLPTIDPGGSL